MSEEDWSYCRAALVQHSRSFALPISGLPPALNRAVTCSYLLCRVADTVEDTVDWDVRTKETLQRLLLDVLEEGLPAAQFVQAVRATPGGKADERELLLNLDRIVRSFETCREPLRRSSRAWISELIRGMCIYSRRAPGTDGIVCLATEADLERYCYFVAGTIGHLLTDAFIDEAAITDEGLRLELRVRAERFAAGLQLVNILRDIPADLERGHCFVPRTLLRARGLQPLDLARPECRASARAALEGLYTSAAAHLDAALGYLLALPSAATGIRVFCSVPLCMAVGTLELCRTDPRALDANHRVKLGRSQVGEIVAECLRHAGDDEALRRCFQRSRQPSSEAAPVYPLGS